MQGDLTRKDKVVAFLIGILVGAVVLAVALYQVPYIHDRLSWRVDFAMAFLRGVVDPVRPMPKPVTASAGENLAGGQGTAEAMIMQPTHLPTATPTLAPTIEATGTLLPTATQTPTLPPTPIPDHVERPAPAYETQDVNNCGPATLTMHLRFYGWQGDQSTIASVIKPKSADRNVNVEELAAYVNTQVPNLAFQYRVGGDITMLKRLLAAGFPVTIEEAFIMAESYWFNDDRWAGHYLLLTGYDEATQQFTAQDVFVGPNIGVAYKVLDKNWEAFNRVYIILYPPERQAEVQAVLGDQWDVDANRQHALDVATQASKENPTDSYAYFNMGTNLVYFEKYSQAAAAFDQARVIGLPQRMLRYQFGPFFAYFHTDRIDDLLALTEYALKRTPNSEEALMWRGWAMYRKGDKEQSIKLFQEALDARDGNYPDAEYGLTFVRDH
jgi:tetratricopeptide (TPR) repeat protein